jgi:hypothetical protein
MARRFMILAAICLFLPALAMGQQASPAALDGIPLQELQDKLDGWRQTLKSIDIDQLKVSTESHSLLQAKDSCLAWLQVLTGQLSHLRQKPALDDQSRLLLEIVQFQNATSNYSQEFRHAYQAASEPAGGNVNLALKWMNQTGAIVSEAQGFYEGLEDTVDRNLKTADKLIHECNRQGVRR